jgi:hypothetical protein
MERTAVITLDSEDKVRRAIEAEYARIGSAMAEGDFEAIRTVYAADFRGSQPAAKSVTCRR